MARKRKTPADYHAAAAVRGGEWIGKELPKNTHTKTWWRCAEGHEWEATYDKVANGGRWCRHCAGNVPKTRADYHAAAAVHDGEWIGKELPKNTNTKTQWRCADGHEWEARYDDVANGGSWCRKCHIIALRTIAEADYHAAAAVRGGEWIGKELPKNTKTKTQWRCADGHEREATYNSVAIGGRWCPHCNQSKGETAVADTLTMLNIPFQAQKRFRKCRNTDGNALPFDFHFHYGRKPFLVEYDGRQHFGPVDRFGGEESFEMRQRHDAIKDDFATRYGYTLIRIPYTVEDITAYLIAAIAEAVGCTYQNVVSCVGVTPTDIPAASKRPLSSRLSSKPPIGVQLPLDFF